MNNSKGREWPWIMNQKDRQQRLVSAVHDVLSTIPGERVMRPQYGCQIHKMGERGPGVLRDRLVTHCIRSSLTRHLAAEFAIVSIEVETQTEVATTGQINGRDQRTGEVVCVPFSLDYQFASGSLQDC
jgi:hypothetical protein